MLLMAMGCGHMDPCIFLSRLRRVACISVGFGVHALTVIAEIADVPLGEESELYQVRVLVDGALIRELTTSDPDWFYSDSQRSADGVADAFGIEISQISARYGAGPARAVRVNAA